MQGFERGWTAPAALACNRKGTRWKLVGNAVTVGVSRWVGERLANPGSPGPDGQPLQRGQRWPTAAYGERGTVQAVDLSLWPPSRESISTCQTSLVSKAPRRSPLVQPPASTAAPRRARCDSSTSSSSTLPSTLPAWPESSPLRDNDRRPAQAGCRGATTYARGRGRGRDPGCFAAAGADRRQVRQQLAVPLDVLRRATLRAISRPALTWLGHYRSERGTTARLTKSSPTR